MAGRLEGKVALVTGGGRGIGREEVLLLAREGAKVVINDLGTSTEGQGSDGGVAQAMADEIRAAGGDAVANGDSVAEMAGGRRMVECAMDHFGRLDILINNAGITKLSPIYEMSEEDWDIVHAVNTKGVFTTVRHAAPIMMQQRSGVIINTCSASGLGHLHMSNYASSKEAVVGFTRSIARDLGPYGIRCNAIRPMAQTRMSNADIAETMRISQRQFGIPAVGNEWLDGKSTGFKPEQVAAVVVWLATDKTKSVNGRTFMIARQEVGLYTEPEATRVAFHPDGWDLDALDSPAAQAFLAGVLKNVFQPAE
ncbi:SDR family NAD(P)-dependent oxidoreductase [Rhizorhabdus dicambivorans]|uniref:Short-chain dehydrogenase n=1 Tax=Rhizorhabdus dicambivorans TaxID=1850238 RepID=A0A2A4FS64_9SPHN|nr:SDR family NAD(P)-dependent oxidoreductase [Rhizorhabdus dicambivorans]ATE64267.1 short-chain dehydrogenase [Rhizorhabdus dicambivorans]PCE40560.1 short-chain dehydrogenase [Rhizorhabdus dicambivorans]